MINKLTILGEGNNNIFAGNGEKRINSTLTEEMVVSEFVLKMLR